MSEQNGESEIIVRAASGEVRATDKGERYVVLKTAVATTRAETGTPPGA